MGSVASGVRARQQSHIFLDVPLEPQKTLEFFRDALAQSGWEPRRPFDEQLRNFASDGLVIFCKEGAEGFRGLQSASYEEGVTPMRLFGAKDGTVQEDVGKIYGEADERSFSFDLVVDD